MLRFYSAGGWRGHSLWGAQSVPPGHQTREHHSRPGRWRICTIGNPERTGIIVSCLPLSFFSYRLVSYRPVLFPAYPRRIFSSRLGFLSPCIVYNHEGPGLQAVPFFFLSMVSILRAARSSLSITVDEERTRLRAVFEGPGISTQPTYSTECDVRVSVNAKFRRLPRILRFSVRLLSRPVSSAGTRAYCPPEFFVRDQYHATPGTVWSLGCMMFDLLTWKMPFKNPRDAVTAPLIPENLSKGEYKLSQKQTTNKQTDYKWPLHGVCCEKGTELLSVSGPRVVQPYLVLQVGIFWELINIVKSPPFKGSLWCCNVKWCLYQAVYISTVRILRQG